VANAAALDANGQLYAAGFAPDPSSILEMRLWRFTPSGNLDKSFNGTGYVAHPGSADGSGSTVGLGVATEPGVDGDTVVCGYSIDANQSWGMTVWRYRADGTLDPAFATNGYYRYTAAESGGVSCAIDSNGEVVVAGFRWNGSDWDMAVWRLSPTGDLDTTLFHNGAAGGDAEDIGVGVLIDGSGRILVTGYSSNSDGSQDMALWRLTSAGALDLTFSGDGVFTHADAGGITGDDGGRAIALDGTDIIVTGYSPTPFGGDAMALWRLDTNGLLDAAFSSNGYLTHDGAAGGFGRDEGRAVQIDVDHNVLVLGSSVASNGRTEVVLWRYLPDGSPDTSIDGTGFLVFSETGTISTEDTGRALALTIQGRAWAVGVHGNSTAAAEILLASHVF
jgi:uncharacterized delta-60 repeat protein